MNNKTTKNPNERNPNKALLWSLIAGTAVFFIALALGLKSLPPAHHQRNGDASVVTSPSPATVTPQYVEPTASMMTTPDVIIDPADIASEYDDSAAVSDNESNFDEPDPATLSRAQELQYLKEVLPDNQMIPVEKTPQEVDALFAEFEEYHKLQALIDSGKASPEEKDRFYALRMEKYDEEIALIHLCNEVAANSIAYADEQQAQLCTHVAETGEERLQVIEESIQELEQQTLFSSRTE